MGILNYLDWAAFGLIAIMWIQMVAFSMKSIKHVEMQETFQTCIKSFFICAGTGIVSIIWLLTRHMMNF